MIRHLKVWQKLLTLGPTRRVARDIEEIFRFAVIQTLANEGLFDYLKEPRSYGEILTQLVFVDSKYTRELFDLLPLLLCQLVLCLRRGSLGERRAGERRDERQCGDNQRRRWPCALDLRHEASLSLARSAQEAVVRRPRRLSLGSR